MAEVIYIKWEKGDLVDYLSNQSAYVAQSISMGGEVAFDATTLTRDNTSTYLDEKIADAINSLVAHFTRIIADGAEVISGEEVGISFTPRIDGGAYSQAELSQIKTLCKKVVASYILTDWYSLKGIAAMSGHFASQNTQSSIELDVALDRFVRPLRRSGISIRSISVSEEEQQPTSNYTEVDFDCSDPVVGSQLLMSFRMEPVGDVHLSECEFEVSYYTTTIEKCHTIEKGKMTEKSEDEYLALVETDLTGAGTLKYVATITIPHEDIENGIKLVKNVTTTVNIRPMPK